MNADATLETRYIHDYLRYNSKHIEERANSNIATRDLDSHHFIEDIVTSKFSIRISIEMSNNVSHYVTASVAAAGVLGSAYCAYRLYQNYQNKPTKIPETWTQVGVLKTLSVFPIKSCGAILLNQAECTLLGLKDGWLRDRVLMVVDEKNNFITARVYPELFAVEPSFKISHYVTASVAAAGVLGSAYCAYRLYQNYQNKPTKIPETWTQVGVLKTLSVFPIKSCGAILLNQAECTLLGLKDGWLRDRVLMVVDEKNNFITARVYPELFAVEPSFKSSVLTLKHANMESVSVNLAEVVATQKRIKAVVWGDPVPVYDCGREVSEWFTKVLNRNNEKYRLVYYASENCRKMVKADKYYKFGKNDTGAFPDETSYNLINEASVEDLDRRVESTRITTNHFRPNFLLTGAKPYEEDNWKFVKIGENVFEIIKPCMRCLLTTIDPETGIRDPKVEPLTTLRKYRLAETPAERKAAGNSPRMGLQMTLRSGPGGLISVNDPIYAA
uniref:MOSC domain-containing protein n=1 Tax=Heliothis virescens TaxID=7102 RepID=A0A2A4J1D0_HELVI